MLDGVAYFACLIGNKFMRNNLLLALELKQVVFCIIYFKNYFYKSKCLVVYAYTYYNICKYGGNGSWLNVL